MKPWISLLLFLLAAPAGAAESDRAEELTRRVYCLHAVSKDLLATGTTYGLVLYRLNDRGFPTRAGALQLDDAVTAITSRDDLVFVGNGPRGLVVVDVSDPDAPALVTRLELPGAVLRLLRGGDELYVAMGTMGVGVIDVSKPRAPTLAKRIKVDGSTRDLCYGRGGFMVAADSFAWVQRPRASFPHVSYTGIMKPSAVVGQEQFLVNFLVAGQSKIIMVDAEGFVAGGGQVMSFGDEIRDLEKLPHGVAVAASSDGLILLAIDGSKNTIAARLDPGGAYNRVHARGDLLFATADAYGFAVYNVKDLKAPVKIYPADVPEP